MSAVTVGNYIKQGWSELFLEKSFLAAECVDDCKRVVAVHALCVHRIWLEAGSETCRIGISHCLAACLASHCILVVHDIEEDWQSALHVTFPERVELVHGSECHAFEDWAAGH